MKAIIHIGHHKTGTTSLQSFLAVNWARLLAAGILYPWIESEGAAWGQAQLLRGEAVDPELLPASLREPHNGMAFRMLAKALPERNVPPHHRNTPMLPMMLRAIRNQAELLEPEVMVFCSEVMGHFGIDAPDLIDTLAEPLDGAELVLHVTLRRPDDHLVAWHGQELWFGAPRPALSNPVSNPFEGVHFDYRAMIEPWLERMPGIAPHIRAHRAMMRAGGSITDFFTRSGLALPEGAAEVPVMNPSLPRAFYPLMRAANAALPRPAARSLGPDLVHIAGMLALPAPDEIEFFGPARRAEMVERFAPIHDWLAGISGGPLFDDLDEIARTRPVSEDEALAQVLGTLTSDHIAGFSNPAVRRFVADLKQGRAG
ncbi:MAG: hypothetical protein AUK37_00680 [Rhodobacterales bacterium CG2_30_65_12]|nr:MAG: hypothetical protein AUK37_00680 [Rhodobacterales bacterium CG2_30_65_12]